jgi:outer membrane protein OmpA-like peptidoglycan-associated protein
MNQNAEQLNLKPLEPGSSLDLAEARNAVDLARLAGADRFAKDSFDKAAGLLATAEEAREKRRGSNAVMMPARQAAQTAEDARLIGLQRQEEAFLAEQQRQASAREQGALDLAQAEAARRLQAERDTQVASAERAAAERDAQAAIAGRASAEFSARAASEGQAAAERATADADAARSAADAARLQAEAAQRTAEAQTREAQSAAVQSEQDKAALRDRLRTQLNVILETRETARGLIVNLSDVLFDTGSATLKPGAREKLARVAGVLASHPGLSGTVEGHTDSVGSSGFNQQLSEQRASVVRDYLVRQGLTPGAIGTAGHGESQPVASNRSCRRTAAEPASGAGGHRGGDWTVDAPERLRRRRSDRRAGHTLAISEGGPSSGQFLFA